MGLRPVACWDCRFESRRGMDVLFCEFCVLSVRGLCDWLITRPEESYRVWCVWVWSWIIDSEEALAHWWLLCHGKNSCVRTVAESFIMAIEINTSFLFLISNLCHVMNALCFLLGDSPASEFYMSTFRNTLFHLHRPVGMKNELGLTDFRVFILIFNLCYSCLCVVYAFLTAATLTEVFRAFSSVVRQMPG